MTRQDLESRKAIEAVWRIEAASIIGGVARIVRDVGLAEEFAQDALLAALEHWPVDGIPEKPGAWLLTTARRRALDHLRHKRFAAEKAMEIGRELDFQHELATAAHAEAVDTRLDDPVGDDTLRLIFTACHPMLPAESRCMLTLRVMGGLSTTEIARAYLKPEPTVAQRIVRAKRALSQARIPFELPTAAELHPRLGTVLEVLYLIFNEGYAATTGGEWTRPALCEEATRLTRMLTGLMPGESEAFGLLALMELQASRLKAQVSSDGEPVLLMDQDRSRWDRIRIHQGLTALARAEALSSSPGSYTLQAAIAACHARASAPEHTDWGQIAALYGTLARLTPSPIIELNRAVAVGMASGPEDGLAIVDALCNGQALQGYHLLPSVRGDLLLRLNRRDEARIEFERAATLTRNTREQALLRSRAKRCNQG